MTLGCTHAHVHIADAVNGYALRSSFHRCENEKLRSIGDSQSDKRACACPFTLVLWCPIGTFGAALFSGHADSEFHPHSCNADPRRSKAELPEGALSVSSLAVNVEVSGELLEPLEVMVEPVPSRYR